jgi:septum formation protein
MTDKTLILASASPRRRELLGLTGLHFTIDAPDVDETCSLAPREAVKELSRRKAEAVRDLLKAKEAFSENTLLLASDTVVAVDATETAPAEILGKPRDAADADRMLRLLSGRCHRVVSGIALLTPRRCITAHEVTRVRFAPLTDRDRAFYVRSGDPFGKAGAYAVQGLASLWIEGLEGDYFNVVGLPVHRLFTLLESELGLYPGEDGSLIRA